MKRFLIIFLIVNATALAWYVYPDAVKSYNEYKVEKARQEKEARRLSIIAEGEKSYQEYLERKAKMKPRLDRENREAAALHLNNQQKMNAEYLEKYKRDNKNVNALYGLTQTHWLMSRAYTRLEKEEESKKEYETSLKYLKEFDEKMTEGWKDEAFREGKQHEILSLIKFYHNLYEDIPRAVHWRKRYLDHLMDKWNGGQKDRETACWIHNMYSTISTYIPYEQRDLQLEWSQKSVDWYNNVIKTFPIIEGRKMRCHLPHYA